MVTKDTTATRKMIRERLEAGRVESGRHNCHHIGLHSVVVETRGDRSLLRIFYTTPNHGMRWLFQPGDEAYPGLHFVFGAHNHNKALDFTLLYGNVYNVEVALKNYPSGHQWHGWIYPFYQSALLEGGFKLGDPEPVGGSMVWAGINGKHLETSDIHTVVVPWATPGGGWVVDEGPPEDVPKVILSGRPDLRLDPTGMYQEMTPEELTEACEAILAGMRGEGWNDTNHT